MLTSFALLAFTSAYSCNVGAGNALRPFDKGLIWFAAALPLLGNAALAFEFVYSNAVLGGYAVPFHGSSPHGAPRVLVELDIFLKRVGTALVGGATLSYVAVLDHGGLIGVAPTTHGPTLWAELINRAEIYFQCWYFTVTSFTTVGFGDISPKNIVGQGTALLIMLQSFCLIVLVFASLMSATAPSENLISQTRKGTDPPECCDAAQPGGTIEPSP